MPTLMQKLRLAFRGWSRRREEANAEFVQRNASWSRSAATTAAAEQPKTSYAIDIEGLTVAYLDDSGRIAHWLDTESGDIVEFRTDEAASYAHVRNPRYRRIPSRSAQSNDADRRAFIESLAPSRTRDDLSRAVGVPEAFRKALASDRTLERGWYNFKNDRAIEAIDRWLHEIGLR